MRARRRSCWDGQMASRRARAAVGVTALGMVTGMVTSGCSATEAFLGSKEDFDNPMGRCVVLSDVYDRPVFTPVESLDDADEVGNTPDLARRGRVGPPRLEVLAEGPPTRAGAEAYVLGWATYALDSRELGDMRPVLREHGPGLPVGPVDAVVKSHCDAYVSAGERRLDLGRPVWVRSRARDEGRLVQVELAGTVAWRSHPFPRQDLSMRVDVERTDDGWELVALQGPRTSPVVAVRGLGESENAPPGGGWRRAG